MPERAPILCPNCKTLVSVPEGVIQVEYKNCGTRTKLNREGGILTPADVANEPNWVKLHDDLRAIRT
jgi:hypothetical protein